jgi:hypothetical protein
MSKDTKAIVAEYERHGFRVVKAAHVKVYDGSRLVAVLSGSHCEGRGDRNARAALRRAIRQRTEQREAP